MRELETRFDLIAIGSGPAGQRAAVQAAKLGKRVALIERGSALGGVSTNTGTVPSKTLRAAIVELTGRAASVYGNAYRVQHEITFQDLLSRTQRVIAHEQEVIADQLRRNGVRVFEGTASFVDPDTLEVAGGGTSFRLTAERIVIAVGTTPARPAGVEFDERTVLDSDGILHLAELPRTLTVIGGGVIGLEYASMAAALGVHVTLVERRPRILDFVDDELVGALQYHLRGLGLVFRLGEEVEAVRRLDSGGAVTRLASGKELPSDVVVYAAGRQGATGTLNLAAGDRSGLLKLLVQATTRKVLGVHIFGTAATELVHVGQTVIAGDLPVDYLVDAVFNVPTFCDAYKVAALDAANRLNELACEPASAAA